MKRSLQWDIDAWKNYLFWQKEDKSILKRINQLIKEILRHPFSGTGKPEPLKGNLKGLWSRRINHEHRLVYIVEETVIIIVDCKGHYN
ncbi:Txe/YoeB family addiction module toxin [Dialister micraerophilus]|uniref:Endoribonuclease YoeB n=1 Tax=Dialister micraerophilus UPII 345-E TaxID=910314 RepID=E4L9K5_9FIRM|nr:Txe/YoeB family addiction module toxin [Dialister micraerophilus]EFR42603.1 addiction module toxin, Txe/YoeB family [Dialister micraerophilus UPII 345-E]